MLVKVGQLMNQHILQQVRIQPSQVGVEPDAGSGGSAGAPARFHLPQTDALESATHHGDPPIKQSRQPLPENSLSFGLGPLWRQLTIGSGSGVDIARTGQTFSSGCDPAALAVDKGTDLVIAKLQRRRHLKMAVRWLDAQIDVDDPLSDDQNSLATDLQPLRPDWFRTPFPPHDPHSSVKTRRDAAEIDLRGHYGKLSICVILRSHGMGL